MKCQILFSGKNKKNISSLPSAEKVKSYQDDGRVIMKGSVH